MGPLSENNSLWEKLQKKFPLSYSDIESYIYTKGYIDSENPADIPLGGLEYNTNLNMYAFEVEEYTNEDDYSEIFFQRYIDGDISKNDYLNAENRFLKMMELLFSVSKTIVYYCNEGTLESNSPFAKSADIEMDAGFFEQNNDKFFYINNKQRFTQLCRIAAREIEVINFVFSDIQAVIMGFGMHGYIFAENPLPAKLCDSISNEINFHKVCKSGEISLLL